MKFEKFKCYQVIPKKFYELKCEEGLGEKNNKKTLGELFDDICQKKISSEDIASKFLMCEHLTGRQLAEFAKLLPAVNPANCGWFYYGTDDCLDEPSECHNFFLVQGNRIVFEDVQLFERHGDKTNLEELFDQKEYEEIWSGSKRRELAAARYIYNLFYKETIRGQIEKELERMDEEDESAERREDKEEPVEHEGSNVSAFKNQQQLVDLLRRINQKVLLVVLILAAFAFVFMLARN